MTRPSRAVAPCAGVQAEHAPGVARLPRTRARRQRNESGQVSELTQALERDVQGAIVDTLRRLGCLVLVHSVKGARTVKQGFGRGFPDLFVVFEGRVLFIETKRSAKEKPRPDQIAVHETLRRAGLRVEVCWSADLAAIIVQGMRARKARAA